MQTNRKTNEFCWNEKEEWKKKMNTMKRIWNSVVHSRYENYARKNVIPSAFISALLSLSNNNNHSYSKC